jgi:hypothetical protein
VPNPFKWVFSASERDFVRRRTLPARATTSVDVAPRIPRGGSAPPREWCPRLPVGLLVGKFWSQEWCPTVATPSPSSRPGRLRRLLVPRQPRSSPRLYDCVRYCVTYSAFSWSFRDLRKVRDAWVLDFHAIAPSLGSPNPPVAAEKCRLKKWCQTNRNRVTLQLPGVSVTSSL